ncbi:hypothetical protein M3Y99_01742900 [Aphelenchoides fujianensis]|nr:hypothetical protein M3Y99_01742900 [Aphelenchoides fujianensis]
MTTTMPKTQTDDGGPPEKRRRTAAQPPKAPKTPRNARGTAAGGLKAEPPLDAAAPAGAPKAKKPAEKRKKPTVPGGLPPSAKPDEKKPKRSGGAVTPPIASPPPAEAADQPPPPPKEPRCTDIFSEKWAPEFKSTYPLSKALERRKVLVEYIQLVKRCRARVDKVESPPKRNVVTQPQTMEELEREVEKCDLELEQAAGTPAASTFGLPPQQPLPAASAASTAGGSFAGMPPAVLAAANAGGLDLKKYLQSLAQQNPAAFAASSTAGDGPGPSGLQSAAQLPAGSSASALDALKQAGQHLHPGLNPAQLAASSSAAPTAQQNVDPRMAAFAAAAQQQAMQKSLGIGSSTAQRPSPSANLMQQAASSSSASGLLSQGTSALGALGTPHNPFASASQSGLLTQQSQGGLISQGPQTQPGAQQPPAASAAHQTGRAALGHVPTSALNAAAAQNVFREMNQAAMPANSQQANAQQQLQELLSQWNVAAGVPGGLAALNGGQVPTAQQLATLTGLHTRFSANSSHQPPQQQAAAAQQQQQQQQQQLHQQKQLQQLQQAAAAHQQTSMAAAAFQQQLQQAQMQQQQATSESFGSQLLAADPPVADAKRVAHSRPQAVGPLGQRHLRRRPASSSGCTRTPNCTTRRTSSSRTPAARPPPQFAVPNLPPQPKGGPPRAQSTRPPSNFSVSSVITSTQNAPPQHSAVPTILPPAESLQQQQQAEAFLAQLAAGNPAAQQQQQQQFQQYAQMAAVHQQQQELARQQHQNK